LRLETTTMGCCLSQESAFCKFGVTARNHNAPNNRLNPYTGKEAEWGRLWRL